MEVCCILLLVGLISLIVLVHVHDIKLIQKNRIWKLSKESSGMYVARLILVYIILLKPIMKLLDFQTPIGLEMLMIGKVLLDDVSMLETILSLGIVRNKIAFPYPLPKLNTSLLVAVVPNCFG